MSATTSEIASKTFDYIVVGGGTAGLVVAARLSEDPNVTVAVLEAGPANLDDPLITIPVHFGKHFGNHKYDWDFSTVPQKSANNAVYKWARGRMLGGSSAINFLAWSKPPAEDMDAWEQLGNPGWNASRYFEYSKKAESFHPPQDETVAKMFKQVVKPDAHGYHGPLVTSFPTLVSGLEIPFQEALSNAGIGKAEDPLNGDPFGIAMTPNTRNPENNTRTYAATAYYLPNKDRKNFHVLTDALVTRIISKSHGDASEVEATGVEFEHDGIKHIVGAVKEVIVSAGALKTPQILELSGIGDKRVLEPLGIETLVDLPGVGANLQEHCFTKMTLELDPKHKYDSLDILTTDPEYGKEQFELHGEGKGFHRLGLSGYTFVPLATLIGPEAALNMIQRQKAKIQAQIDAGKLSKSLQAQYKVQLERLESSRNGDCEIMMFPGAITPSLIKEGRSCTTVQAASNLPFSRGTIHINSTNPHDQPTIDPHTFEDTFDLEALTVAFKFNRKLSNVEPWKSSVVSEILPGPQVESDADIHNYIKKTLETTFHTVGTASMLPRELDGVVDPKLRVYGTKNIRVVDLSIVPLHIAAHTQATAYTIGEIAADIVKGKI
ncbi:GMC oxidoreductase [Schizopora paradoxa]|uniref:GMC oxidoreductase n=1 Tax=Schizopora paradoxa TaxID=27342 RepID=A0A0H2RA31_9AGAM|nr:GMC oxidoreductase [Schizopora paradoxa]